MQRAHKQNIWNVALSHIPVFSKYYTIVQYDSAADITQI